MPEKLNNPLSQRLTEIAQLFLKLGITGFGGPQAHIAMINQEAVERRKWLTQEQFTEGVAVCEMLPGPASTQMGIYTGYLYGGNWGALVAGLCFISPAFLIILVLSWAYFNFQGIPQVDGLFLVTSPIIIAIIGSFCLNLGIKILKDKISWAIALTVFSLTVFLKLNILLQFILAGLVSLIWNLPNKKRNSYQSFLPFLPFLLADIPTEVIGISSFWGEERIREYVIPLSVFFLKIGSLIFGGGLVIIPLLEFEVVEKFKWLTHTEFINGVAIGQLTPGPVVLTAAFVGYKVAGVLGALVATIAIFAPSFAFIMLAAPLLVKLRENPWIKSFLKGITPAVLGAIAAAGFSLAETALQQDTFIQSLEAGVIFFLALIALQRYRTPTWQLILTGTFLGLIIGK